MFSNVQECRASATPCLIPAHEHPTRKQMQEQSGKGQSPVPLHDFEPIA